MGSTNVIVCLYVCSGEQVGSMSVSAEGVCDGL